MNQYISKDAVVAEIERRIKELQDLSNENEKKLDSFQKIAINLCIDECKVVLNILDTLEVKEVETSNDALIEKAVDYLFNNMRCDGYTLQTKTKFIRDFKKYFGL